MMDKGSARGAKLSWQVVLKEYANMNERDISIWYFHEAAMESQLCFHATQPVDSTDPSVLEKYSLFVCVYYMYVVMCIFFILWYQFNIL